MVRCRVCSEVLSLPYIQCAECSGLNINLCLPCFATGSETGTHVASHPYKVIHGNIPVISTSWTAIEDIKMLNSIERYGLDWEMVCTMLPRKSQADCQSHFYKYFVNEPIQKALIIPQNTKPCSRVVSETSGEGMSTALAGLPSCAVDAIRGDWEVRYHNASEEVFMSGEGGDEVVERLQVGLLQKHRRVQQRRRLLENLYYEYGNLLLDTPPPPHPSDTPPQVLETPPPGHFPLQTMLKFSRFLTRDRFEHMQSSCTRVQQLKRSIRELQNLRRQGIRSRFGGEVYEREMKRRAERAQVKHASTRTVRDVFYNNNLSMVTRANNVKIWLRGATSTI